MNHNPIHQTLSLFLFQFLFQLFLFLFFFSLKQCASVWEPSQLTSPFSLSFSWISWRSQRSHRCDRRYDVVVDGRRSRSRSRSRSRTSRGDGWRRRIGKAVLDQGPKRHRCGSLLAVLRFFGLRSLAPGNVSPLHLSGRPFP